jgi:outer membrane protein OmpA-like peptidoglycan-associated protein
MIKEIVAIGVTGLLLSGSGWTAEASQASTQERIGLGSGAVLGGLAGGPLGLVFGAAFGGWLGDQFSDARREQAEFEARWRQASEEVADLNALVIGGERTLEWQSSEYRRNLAAMESTLRDASDVQVLFKTGETSLTDDTRQRLTRLAELLSRMDGMLVRIEGHADARGAPELNEQLSAERAIAVRDVLVQAGVPADRITTDAQGERQASAGSEDADGMAFERRVRLTLLPTGADRAVARE